VNVGLEGHYVVSDPAICHGRPRFRGTRILVTDVLWQVAQGVPKATIVAEWDGRISEAAIAEAIHWARTEQAVP
jgi:uncharacterized protein (DUF433 family)